MGDKPRANHGKQQSEQSAAAGKHEAFGKNLADQPALCGTQRRTNDHFFLARGTPGEQEVGKISADDQHHYADSAGEED